MDTFEKISITTIELVSKQNMSLKEQVENLQQENQFLQKQLATYTNQNVTKDVYPPIEESLNTELTSTPKQIVEEFQEKNADISSKIESECLEKMGDKPIESDGGNKATECMENQRAAIGSKKKLT